MGLKVLYKEQIIPNLAEKLNYSNYHQIPKLEKIQLNRGLGLAAQNSNILKKSIEEFRSITGQKPVVTKSKKANAGFKIREDMDLGIKVTLRGEKMYTFFDKLVNITLPELSYEDVEQIRGLEITIVTTGNTKDDSKALL